MTTTERIFDDLECYDFNGVRVLEDILRTSVFETPAQAVAALTKFSHPRTVSQTRNSNIFRTIRRSNSGDVGKYIDSLENGRLMLDDNRSPTNAVVWPHSLTLKRCKDVQFNHVWADAKNVALYTSLANICITPSFLAKLTDTDKHICGLLQYRAFELFDGFKPENEPVPKKPAGYDGLAWAASLPEVNDLEASFRRAMQTKPKDRTVRTVQELGW